MKYKLRSNIVGSLTRLQFSWITFELILHHERLKAWLLQFLRITLMVQARVH